MTKILVVDNEHERYEYVKQALVGDIESPRKIIFKKGEVICPEENYIDKIAEYARNKQLAELYFYLFKIIEENKIDIVFIDMHLKNQEDKLTTGEILIEKILNNKLHQKLPIVAYSRKISDDSKLHNPEVLLGKGVRFIGVDESSSAVDIRGNIGGDISTDTFSGLIKRYRNREFDYNLAILCALDIEYEPIKELIDDLKEINENDRIYEKGYILNEARGVILKTIGRTMGNEYGKSNARSESEKILNTFKPNYITMTGVAGGHKDNINLGDVVIVRHTFDWEEVKYDNEILPRYNPFVTDKKIKNKVVQFFLRKEKDFLHQTILESYSDKKTILELIEDAKQKETDANAQKPHSGKIVYYFAPVATGSAVINNQDKMDEIKSKQDKIGALDMEIYSLYDAAYDVLYNVKALAIKGIVDYGDGDKQKKWQKFASYASAQTLYKLFTEYIDIG